MKALTAATIARNFATIHQSFFQQVCNGNTNTVDTFAIEGDKVLVWRGIYIIATYTVHGNSRKGYTFQVSE
jgi:hypothetical protein